MEQLLLFADEVVLDCRWRSALSEADLPGAAGVLSEQERLYPERHGEWAARRAALSSLDAVLSLPTSERLERLAGLVRCRPRDPAWATLHPDPKVVESGLWAALCHGLPAGRVAPFANGLFPAEAFVQRQDWSAAAACIRDSLREFGESALLRQLQAWVLHHQGHHSRADDCLAMALIYDAGSCRAEFLHQEYQPLFTRSAGERGDGPATWQALAFVAWRRGLLPVPLHTPAFHRSLDGLLRRSLEALSSATCEAAEEPFRGQIFLRFFYLAEAARARRDPIDEVLRWRTPMQQFAPDLFQEYMRAIEG